LKRGALETQSDW